MDKNEKFVQNLLGNLTDEQKQFVEFNNGNALVSASAGSGKTSTMIKKLVFLLVYYDVEIEDLLVVTFTNSAGAELKQKLYFELLNEINTTKNEDVDKQKLYEKLEKISSCDIGTLHSVCYKYILKYFYKCNIDPESKILSEADTNYLLEEAIKLTLEKYSNDDEFYEVFDAYSSKRNNLKLVNILKKLYSFLMSIPNIDEFKSKTINNPENLDINTNICAKYIFETLNSSFNEYEKIFSELKIESETLNLSSATTALSYILNFIKLYKSCDNFSEAHKLIFEDNSIPRVNFPKQCDGLILDFKERYQSLRKRFAKLLNDLQKLFVKDDINSILTMEQSVNKTINKLFAVVFDIQNIYNNLKQSNNGLDYNDLEHKMLEILQDESVLNELKNKYKFIFVDEYQDINNFQEEILQKLSNGKNMYMIGDVKQSIYGFRLCTPDIFIQKYYLYKNKNTNEKSIEFNRNFRSVDTILQFVNYIFSVIGTKDTIGIDYKSSAMLDCGMNRTNNFESDKCVELNIINKEDKSKEDEDDNDEEIDPNKEDKVQAKLIVNKIKEYLTKQYFNFKTKKLTNIDYKDIAILIRNKSEFLYRLYIELLNNNIPVSTELKLKLFDEYEVNLLISYLKILSNFKDDLSLATILHSSIVGLSNNELAKIRKFNNDYILQNQLKDENSNLFSVAVLNYALNNDDEISFKINKLLKELKDFRFQLNSKNLREVVINIITFYNLNNYFYSFKDGNQKLTNISLFLDLLNNQNYSNNLNKFLSYLEVLQNKDYSCNIQNGTNFVTITTMHKSKGLDYPVVIVCNLDEKFSTQSSREDVILTNDLGVGLKYYDLKNRKIEDGLSYIANKLNKKLNEAKEQLRLFYVALTRAQNYLCLFGYYDINKIENLKFKDILDLNSFMKLVIYAILKNGHINKLQNSNSSIKINDNMCFNINIINNDDIEYQVFDKKLEIKENDLFVDNEILIDLKRNFSFIYPYSKAKNIALKTSVTGIMEDDYVEINESPKELKINETINNKLSLEIGNAYHAIMEQIDYFKEQNVYDIFKNLMALKLIDKNIANYVDLNKIEIAVKTIKGLIDDKTEILKEQQFIIKDKHKNLIQGSDDDTSVMVQGVIDLVLINNGIATLIDFKTNRTNDVESLKEKYGLQLKLYSYALEHGKNIVVQKKYLYSFFLNKLIEM